jgi:cytochrome c oxidase assembly factor CtaG
LKDILWWCAARGVEWTWTWQAYPGVWLFVAALVFAFFRLERRDVDEPLPGASSTRWRRTTFLIGAGALWIVLDWPIGAIGAGYLASVHMVQFLVLALIVPALLLLSIREGDYRDLARRLPEGPFRAVTHPLVTLATFTIVLAATHWPPVVDTLMPNQAGNMLLDLMWLVTGLLFWWPIVAPVPVRRGWTYPTKMVYLIATTLVNTGTFAYLTFTDLPVFSTYELAPPFPGISTRDDQTLAGLLMKIGGAAILWTAITILFALWYRESEEVEPTPA